MYASAARHLRSIAEMLGILALSLAILSVAAATAVGVMTAVAMLVASGRIPMPTAPMLLSAVCVRVAVHLAPSALRLVALGLLAPRSTAVARLNPRMARVVADGVGATYAVVCAPGWPRSFELAELVSSSILGAIGAVTGSGAPALAQRTTQAGRVLTTSCQP